MAVDAWETFLILALCGWTMTTVKASNERMWNRFCIKIGCKFCRRSLGLWSYKQAFPDETARGLGNSLRAGGLLAIAEPKSYKGISTEKIGKTVYGDHRGGSSKGKVGFLTH